MFVFRYGKVVSTFIFYICLKKDMAEEITGDLVRKSKVFLFPYFLFCEKQICCRSCCKSFAVSLKGSGKVDPFSRARVQDFPISGWNNNYNQRRKS